MHAIKKSSSPIDKITDKLQIMLQQYTCINTAIPDERTIILRQNFVDEGHFNLGNARR